VFQIPIDTSLVKTCLRGVHEHDDIHFVSGDYHLNNIFRYS
jgi:hypothetical protein